ncbi:MAG: hypothetical protein ACYS67_17060 [Planctomycetota bacterium]|jgi:hypothetical protein
MLSSIFLLAAIIFLIAYRKPMDAQDHVIRVHRKSEDLQAPTVVSVTRVNSPEDIPFSVEDSNQIILKTGHKALIEISNVPNKPIKKYILPIIKKELPKNIYIDTIILLFISLVIYFSIYIVLRYALRRKRRRLLRLLSTK